MDYFSTADDHQFLNRNSPPNSPQYVCQEMTVFKSTIAIPEARARAGVAAIDEY